MALPTTKERVFSLVFPALLLYAAFKYFAIVCAEAIYKHWSPQSLFHPYKLRDESFSRFWLYEMSTPPPDDVSKLEGSAKLIPPLLSHARGDVLDVGPGSGMQLRYFPNPSSSAVKRIYGAEPSTGLHAKLRKSAIEAGHGDAYVIVPSEAEEKSLATALARAGIIDEPTNKAGLFDTIVCVRVLCSVPEPLQTIENFYRLLKPGGTLLVAEHVANPWRSAKGSLVARLMQAFYMLLGWQFFVGNCCLDRDLEGLLGEGGNRGGGWESVELERHFGWSALPYISGILTKK